jgi:hypothetical protein
MNPIRIIKLVIIAAAVGMGTGVGWSWTDFATQPLRVKIANARSNQASGNQYQSQRNRCLRILHKSA